MPPKGRQTAAKRKAARADSLLPRTGKQISVMRQTYAESELTEYVQANPHILDTLVFICKSGMLAAVQQDLLREHWLPESNKFFHKCARAFFALALTMMMPGDITTDLLQDLTDVDVDSIWKLLFWATGTTRNTKVPTLHKYSFLKLLVDLHDSWGRRLATIDWQTVDRVSGFDWSLCEYELVVEAKLIKTIRHRDSGKPTIFHGLCQARLSCRKTGFKKKQCSSTPRGWRTISTSGSVLV